MQAQVAVLTSPGQFNSLRFQDTLRPPVLPHQIEIRVQATALNFKDVLLALGLIPTPEGSPIAFGFECAGVVDRVGAGVTSFRAGDEVLAIGTGCLADLVCVPEETVTHRPAILSAAEAVTLPIAFSTASYALEDLAHLRAKDRVLIHAASGGVGLAAIQIAQAIGAEIFATAGSDEKRQYLRDRGIKHVMNSRDGAFLDEVLTSTGGQGVDVVLNSLSGELMELSLKALAPHGRFIELGARDAIAGHTLALSAFARGASFCAVGYQGPIPGLGTLLAKLMKRISGGEIKPLPSRTFNSANAGDAFAYLASARHIGKVVVEISSASSGLANLISGTEGARLFELCLSGTRANLAVSKVPLDGRLRAQPIVESKAPAAKARHPRPELDIPFVAPRTETEQKIAEAWASHFGLQSIGVNDDFFDLGGDSLLAVQVAYSMRSALNMDLPTHLILENPTVEALASRLTETSPDRNMSRHLVQLAKGPAGASPIFLVHPIGGHVYFYLPLANRLASTAPVYGLQAQGVDGEAPPLSTIEEMAQGYIEAMQTIQPAGPYRIGGSSFGGVVCFEMARQLGEMGHSLELLVLMDSPAPSSLPSYFRSNAEILAYLLAKGGDLNRHLQEISALSEDEMLHYFLQHGGAGERLAPGATIESVRHFLRLFRTNYDALVTYRPRHRLQKGIFFCPSESDRFNPGGYEREWVPFFEDLELIPVPGNHTTMNLPPNYEGMVQRIQSALTI